MLIVMFVRQSSGLMLYWLTGNLVGVAQQYFINKRYRTDVGKNRQDTKEYTKEEDPPQEAIVSELLPPDDTAEPKRRRRRGHRKS